MRIRILLLWLLLLPASGGAMPLVADLSNHEIHIGSDFAGTSLLLFGAQNERGEILAVIRSPEQEVVMRKKRRVLGIWVNKEEAHFTDVPFFYGMAATHPVSELGADTVLRGLEAGKANLRFEEKNWGELNFDQRKEFIEAFLQYQQKHGLYAASPVKIQFMGESLFKAHIPFPDNIPRGNYTAEIYLIRDGAVAAAQVLPLVVSKRGMEAFVAETAFEYPLLYGLAAVALALMGGWAANRMFA